MNSFIRACCIRLKLALVISLWILPIAFCFCSYFSSLCQSDIVASEGDVGSGFCLTIMTPLGFASLFYISVISFYRRCSIVFSLVFLGFCCAWRIFLLTGSLSCFVTSWCFCAILKVNLFLRECKVKDFTLMGWLPPCNIVLTYHESAKLLH